MFFPAKGTDARNRGIGGGARVWALLVALGSVTVCLQLIHFTSHLCLRFLSDPDLGGCEKVIISSPVPSMCTKKPNLTAMDVTADGGWTRSFAAWVVMVAMYESEEIFQAS